MKSWHQINIIELRSEDVKISFGVHAGLTGMACILGVRDKVKPNFWSIVVTVTENEWLFICVSTKQLFKH